MQTKAVGGGLAGALTPRTTSPAKGASSFAALLGDSLKDQRTQNTAAGGDSLNVQYSRGTIGRDYQEKLDYLSKLNEETDWASMTDVEKVRTFEDRYRDMFGRENLLGLYSGMSKQHTAVYESFRAERSKYLSKGGIAELKSSYQDCYRQAYYENVPEDELRAAIRDRYQDDGTMESKYTVLSEYSRAGVGKSVDYKIMSRIQYEIYRKVEISIGFGIRSMGTSATDDPRFGSLFLSYARGIGDGGSYMPGWRDLTQGVMDSYRNADSEFRMSEAELEQLRRELEEFLNEMLG